MKVVIVDDSAADRKLCRVLLEEVHGSKLQVYEESGAESALATCHAVRPDCVLLDYKLPGMSGLEFLRRLRADTQQREPDFAVVMLTGLASDRMAVDAMKAGAQDYLVKDRITADGLSLAIGKATQKVGLLRDLREERDRLSRSLAEKEVLIQEVHHRVKNNLQVISSLLRLQAGAMANGQMLSALRDSQHRVESMALIHEQLYESGDLREVDIARNSRLLMVNLFDSYGVDPARITGDVRIPHIPGQPPLVLGVDQAIPSGLILNELISNALKHAFPENAPGLISVEGERNGSVISLAVRDNGVGIPSDFEERSSKSLGMQIIKILTRQLRGEFTVERGRETAFRITFPEPMSR